MHTCRHGVVVIVMIHARINIIRKVLENLLVFRLNITFGNHIWFYLFGILFRKMKMRHLSNMDWKNRWAPNMYNKVLHWLIAVKENSFQLIHLFQWLICWVSCNVDKGFLVQIWSDENLLHFKQCNFISKWNSILLQDHVHELLWIATSTDIYFFARSVIIFPFLIVIGTTQRNHFLD